MLVAAGFSSGVTVITIVRLMVLAVVPCGTKAIVMARSTGFSPVKVGVKVVSVLDQRLNAASQEIVSFERSFKVTPVLQGYVKT